MKDRAPKDVSAWSATTDRIRDLCTRIFAQAVPTFDILLMVAMLNALEHKADHIRSEMTSNYISMLLLLPLQIGRAHV